jgi:hypothetical protein
MQARASHQAECRLAMFVTKVLESKEGRIPQDRIELGACGKRFCIGKEVTFSDRR